MRKCRHTVSAQCQPYKGLKKGIQVAVVVFSKGTICLKFQGILNELCIVSSITFTIK